VSPDPILYGLKACPLIKSDLHSLDFVINRFFMKLFKTSNIDTVRSFLALKYSVLYGLNVSINLSLNLQSSLALISRLAFNGITDI